MSQREALGLRGQPVRYGNGHNPVSFGTPMVISDDQNRVGSMSIRLETTYGGKRLAIVVQAGWVRTT